MIYTLKMTSIKRTKIAVLCNKITQNRLQSCLIDKLVDTHYYEHAKEVLAQLENEHFDIFLADCQHEEAYLICRAVHAKNQIPITLLVRANDLNWSDFGSWEVDSFIPEEATNLELLARVKAVARRAAKHAVSPFPKSNP